MLPIKLNVSIKMLVPLSALIISVLYVQVEGSPQNGTNNLSNFISSNGAGTISQGGLLQKSLNQFTQNHPNSLQPANLQRYLSLQQANNLQQELKSQQPNSLQMVNTQQQPQMTSNVQQTSNLQQPGSLQLSSNLQSPANAIQPNNVQQNANFQQHPTSGNVQILRQFFEVPVTPIVNAPISQSNQGVPSNLAITKPQPQENLCNVDSSPATPSSTCPQNQQIIYSGVPQYVADRSHVMNAIPAQVSSGSAAPSSQPGFRSVLKLQPQNQQPLKSVQNLLVQKPTEIQQPNQITYSVPAPTPEILNQNQISWAHAPSQPLQPSYTAALPTASSILVSALTQQASKSSSLKALLPLIINLMKEKNSCGCQHHCGCPANNRNQMRQADAFKDYSQHQRYFRPSANSKYVDDYSDEFDENQYHDIQTNKRRRGKARRVKPESEEYDYSDELDD